MFCKHKESLMTLIVMRMEIKVNMFYKIFHYLPHSGQSSVDFLVYLIKNLPNFHFFGRFFTIFSKNLPNHPPILEIDPF
jgi:hypothetical protein